MTFVDKGEMRSYWVDDQDTTIFPGSLATVFVRTYAPQTCNEIQLQKTRHLINIIKSRCLRDVDIGRNVAIDEASIACRSRYAQHIIACCCSTTWYVISFKLHCASDPNDRMDGVAPQQAILRHADLIANASGTRSHVMEVTASLKGSCRIINEELP
ncbi:hypothetical protein GN958_ATG00197 [Phytophthora infestans]|uniref:PiggyBac transposable element-derived protein domain-containing protein n=1 Tax=Phytophthora infestans TaxID=4787 RepID=A0A8S9VC65_PHYIN|nr:hypothetical protein GN958_ATG00197 [Phytophthora infestans]